SSLIEPLTIFPPGGSSPMMDRPVIDLPQPDSPTSPSASPGSTVRSTLPTACTTDLVSWMCVDRSLIDRTGGIRVTPGRRPGGRIVWHESSAAQPDVQRVAERVAKQVAGHDHDDDADPDRVDLPPVAVLQVGDPVVEHVAPVEGGVVQAEPEEAQGGDGQDRVGHAERGGDDDHPERVGQQVPVDEPGPAGPGGAGRGDEVPHSQG